jgi:hypothetical protein
MDYSIIGQLVSGDKQQSARVARVGWGDEGTPTNTAGSDANDCR